MLVGAPVFYGGGGRWAAVLLAFFGSSSLLSRALRRPNSGEGMPAIEARGAERDIVQALANGGVAATAAALYAIRPGMALECAFAGSLAAANSDTWATEIGKTSQSPPRLILTGAIVTAGTSGAVSARGTGASVCGSAAIALAAAAGTRSLSRGRHFLAVLVAGLAGSIVDSIVGATLQATYRCPACDTATERRTHSCGTQTILTSGHAWCTNDAVNVVCTATGGLVAAALSLPHAEAARDSR